MNQFIYNKTFFAGKFGFLTSVVCLCLVPRIGLAQTSTDTIVQSIEISLPSVQDTVTQSTIDTISVASSESAIPMENIVLYSDEIQYFDFNEVPVTQDLFYTHCNSMNFTVHMRYNLLVKKQIDYYGTSWQSSLKKTITKSKFFFPLYEDIFAEYNIPNEIKYLSIIESGLDPFARSRSGAVGAWQFIPSTARIFNLTMNSKLDERRSLEKSTHAACKYLTQMYHMYGDWLVALAAYNGGPGNVRKAIRLSGHKDFWGMYYHLPKETQNYVPKFIAMTYMMTFYDVFGIVPAAIDESLYLSEKIYLDKEVDFELIAERLGMSNEDLLQYNPELKVPQIPYKFGEGYELSVPIDKSYLYYENEADILSLSKIIAEEKRIEEAKKPKVTYYYVKKGESLPIIARRHGCTVSQLKKWNGLKGSLIYPKQRLKIYRI